ncbi:MAG TPA: hypothetical protein VMW04_01320 [Patescibacteria group bacterium]|nr:hypothetical protein [Patescibacteria group bacterium]
MKKLLVLPIILVLSLFLARPVSAADFRVECKSGGGCKSEGTSPLFSESEIWYPGKSLDRTFSLKNASSSSKEVAIGVTGHTDDGELEKVMTVQVVNTDNAEVVWQKDTLEKFYTQGKISLGTFSPGETKEFAFKVAMDSSADNEYQNKKSHFDLILGFWEEEATSPTPTPTPTLTGSAQGAWTAQTEWYDGQGGPLENGLGGGIASAAGEVGGAKAPICPFWWIVLLGQTLLLAVFYFLTKKMKGLIGLKWPVTVAIVLLGYLVDQHAHTHWYLPSRMCPLEIWIGGALAILQTKVQPLIMPQKTSRKARVS